MKVLRKQCPWDREQDLASLRKHLVEETHEVLESIETARGGEWAPLRDELGDLLFQIAFLSRLAEEAGAFDLDDVFDALIEKMMRRHPHVFGEEEACPSVAANESRWERMKDEEHRERRSLMDGIPPLPALARAQKVQQRAARVGFDWPDAAGVLDKIQEELSELACEVESGDRDAIEDEFGDVLFAVVNLGRKLGVDAELALLRSNRKFIHRFRGMERLAAGKGLSLASLDAAELEAIYRQSKAQQEDHS